MSEEIWKDVEGYDGVYQVSNRGRVRSFHSRNGIGLSPTPRIMVGALYIGYHMVILCKNGNQRMKKVHRLVAEAFIPNPENKPFVNHKNFVRNDNSVENLEWVTPCENSRHSVPRNKEKGVHKFPGAKHLQAVSVDDPSFGYYFPTRLCVTMAGFDLRAVGRCLKDDSKSHKGFRFYCMGKNNFDKGLDFFPPHAKNTPK